MSKLRNVWCIYINNNELWWWLRAQNKILNRWLWAMWNIGFCLRFRLGSDGYHVNEYSRRRIQNGSMRFWRDNISSSEMVSVECSLSTRAEFPLRRKWCVILVESENSSIHLNNVNKVIVDAWKRWIGKATILTAYSSKL